MNRNPSATSQLWLEADPRQQHHPPHFTSAASWRYKGQKLQSPGMKSVFLSVSGIWIMYEWQVWLMWWYRVSSQPFQGLCVRFQTPTHCAADFKGCGLDSYANKLSLSYTHTNLLSYSVTPLFNTHRFTHSKCTDEKKTHLHTVSTHTYIRRERERESLDFLCSQTGTHRVLCAGWWVWVLGGGIPGFPHLCLQQ